MKKFNLKRARVDDLDILDHQIDFINNLHGDRYYLAWGTGGGKSLCMALKAQWHCENTYNNIFPRVLYICPKSCVAQVKETFLERTEISAHNVSQINDKFFKNNPNVQGRPSKILKVAVVNTDLILSAFSENNEDKKKSVKLGYGRERLQNFFNTFEPQILVVDEMHQFKKYDEADMYYSEVDQYGNIVRRKRKKDSRASLLRDYSANTKSVDFRYGLSGTSVPKCMMDIWSQYYILDQGKRLGSLESYKKFFNIKTRIYNKKSTPVYVLPPEEQDKIVSMVKDITLNVDDEEINKNMKSDLIPTPQDFFFSQPKTPEVTKLCEYVMASQRYQPAVKILKMHQIVNGFFARDERIIGESGEFEEQKYMERVNCWKYDAAIRIIKKFLKNKEQAIVWTLFKEQIVIMEEELARNGISFGTISGAKSSKQRDIVTAKAANGQIDVVLSNIAAGGTGLNLQFIPNSIWLTRSYNFKDMLQSVGRNKRPGFDMAKELRHIYLTTKDSVEDRIISNVKTKKEMHKAFKKYLRDYWRSKRK